jgi:hypothetical protein
LVGGSLGQTYALLFILVISLNTYYILSLFLDQKGGSSASLLPCFVVFVVDLLPVVAVAVDFYHEGHEVHEGVR